MLKGRLCTLRPFRGTVGESKDRKGQSMSRTELSKLIDLVEAGKILGMAPKTLRTWIHHELIAVGEVQARER